jgi:hypothetical protein
MHALALRTDEPDFHFTRMCERAAMCHPDGTYIAPTTLNCAAPAQLGSSSSIRGPTSFWKCDISPAYFTMTAASVSNWSKIPEHKSIHQLDELWWRKCMCKRELRYLLRKWILQLGSWCVRQNDMVWSCSTCCRRSSDLKFAGWGAKLLRCNQDVIWSLGLHVGVEANECFPMLGLEHKGTSYLESVQGRGSKVQQTITIYFIAYAIKTWSDILPTSSL